MTTCSGVRRVACRQNERTHRVAVPQVRGVVPPLLEPVRLLLCPLDEPLLQRRPVLDAKLVDALDDPLPLLLVPRQRPETLLEPRERVRELWHGQLRQGRLRGERRARQRRRRRLLPARRAVEVAGHRAAEDAEARLLVLEGGQHERPRQPGAPVYVRDTLDA